VTTQGKQTLFITADEAAAMPGVSERTLWRPLSVGNGPKPVRIEHNRRWRSGELTVAIERACPGGK
jgi:predicted DNA-binding transcriptional regulator AlpA